MATKKLGHFHFLKLQFSSVHTLATKKGKKRKHCIHLMNLIYVAIPYAQNF